MEPTPEIAAAEAALQRAIQAREAAYADYLSHADEIEKHIRERSSGKVARYAGAPDGTAMRSIEDRLASLVRLELEARRRLQDLRAGGR